MASTLPLLILRPEPGASETAARARAAGLAVRQVPLFEAGPLDWTVPDAADFDALLLTSANASRFGGAGLPGLHALPAWCVGHASAAAATAVGLTVDHVGDGGAQAVIDAAGRGGIKRMLWLAGRDRTPLNVPDGLDLTIISTYHARALPVMAEQLAGPAVALLHSKRAARRLADLAPDKACLTLVAISAPVADAAATGWAACLTAARPDDGEMVAMAAKLCHEASSGPSDRVKQ